MQLSRALPAAIVAPSMLSCDFARLGLESQAVFGAGADWLHMDVMDGHFVPNLTIGPPVLGALRSFLGPDAFLDCHMMVSEPEKWVEPVAKACGSATQYNFHIESTAEPAALISDIKSKGMRAAAAIKPGTPISAVESLLGDLDMVLVMTVEPGFGGQKFMEDQVSKVRALRKLAPTLNIQVDGGLDTETVASAARAGANVIVAGSAIFKVGHEGFQDVISHLRDPVKAAANNWNTPAWDEE